jgi:hypothetical protein
MDCSNIKYTLIPDTNFENILEIGIDSGILMGINSEYFDTDYFNLGSLLKI